MLEYWTCCCCPLKKTQHRDAWHSRVWKWAALRNEAVQSKHLLTSGWNITVNELKKLRGEACANRPSGNSTQPLETAKYSPCNELRETDVKEEKSCEGKTIKGCSPAEPWGQTDTEEPKWKGRWGGGGDESHLKIWSDACRSGTCQQPRYLYLTSLCSVLFVDINALSYLDWILQKGTSIFPKRPYKSTTLMWKCFHMSWNEILESCWIKHAGAR